MPADREAARDRLAEELVAACRYINHGGQRECTDDHTAEADRLIAAGFGDTAALTAEVERLDGRFPHDGSEWRKGYDDALRLVRAALAGTHDQERGA